MSDRRRGRPAARAHGVRRVRRRRLRRRLLGPHRRRPRARRAAPRADRALDRAGLGGQPRLADLHLRRDLDRVLRGLRLDHADAVRPADHRRARHRPARRELRVPQGGRHAAQPPASSAPRSPPRRCSCPTAWARSPAASPRDGSPPAARRATRWTAGSTRPRSSPASSRWRPSPTSPPSTSSGTPGATTTPSWPSTSGGGRSSPPSWSPSSALVGMVVLHADAPYVFDGMTATGAAGRHRRRRLRHRRAGPARPRRHPRRPGARRPRRGRPRRRAGASPSGPTCCPRASPSPTPPRPPARCRP